MANMTTQNNSYRQLLLGNNEFMSVTVKGSGTIPAGTVLSFSNDSWGAGETGSITGAAIACDDIAATSSGVAARVCIAGRVDAKLLKVGESAASLADLNAVRSFGIIPVAVAQIGQLDN